VKSQNLVKKSSLKRVLGACAVGLEISEFPLGLRG